MSAAPSRNNLKFYNLGTTNAITMKLTTIMYLHETFHLAGKLRRKRRALEGVNEKPLKITQKMVFLPNFAQFCIVGDKLSNI